MKRLLITASLLGVASAVAPKSGAGFLEAQSGCESGRCFPQTAPASTTAPSTSSTTPAPPVWTKLSTHLVTPILSGHIMVLQGDNVMKSEEIKHQFDGGYWQDFDFINRCQMTFYISQYGTFRLGMGKVNNDYDYPETPVGVANVVNADGHTYGVYGGHTEGDAMYIDQFTLEKAPVDEFGLTPFTISTMINNVKCYLRVTHAPENELSAPAVFDSERGDVRRSHFYVMEQTSMQKSFMNNNDAYMSVNKYEHAFMYGWGNADSVGYTKTCDWRVVWNMRAWDGNWGILVSKTSETHDKLGGAADVKNVDEDIPGQDDKQEKHMRLQPTGTEIKWKPENKDGLWGWWTQNDGSKHMAEFYNSIKTGSTADDNQSKWQTLRLRKDSWSYVGIQ
eukprot:Selendium_serpulae@DN5174_c0_g1_i5.p1